ncbi:MAG: hypothetical protein BM556_17235 [Bacteriovorax sp. MedPE-SWde]|nr:MAG: hypothetical protein BM556_17235 [Bacteriovorax sp. MedPE-SWde]
MNKLIIVSIASTFALAKDVHLEEFKSRTLTFMDKKIAILQDGRSCINSAGSKEDLRLCREKIKFQMQNFRAESKQAKIDKQKRRLEQKQKKNLSTNKNV